MNLYTGKVKFSPLEGGFWQLQADDGTTYHLVGNLKNLKDGVRISVEGELEKKRFSFAMTGPVLRVQNIAPVED